MDKYGNRSRENEFDNKSLAHAFRTCFQLKEILVCGDYEYPLAEESFLRGLKFDILTEQAQQEYFNRLLELANNLEHDIKVSSILSTTNRVEREINDYLIKTYKDLIREGAGFYESRHGKYFCDDDNLEDWLLEKYGVFKCGN